MRNIVYVFAAAAVMTALSSCNGENAGTLYSGTGGFSFQSSVLNIETGEADNNKLMIPIYRSDTDSNIANVTFGVLVKTTVGGKEKEEYVPLDPEGLFHFTTPRVVFADDAQVAYAQIGYKDLESLGLTKKHKLRLTITNSEDVSPGGKSVVDITANRKLTYAKLGRCIYDDDFIFDNIYEADIYKAEEADVYRVMDPYSEGLVAEDYVSESYACTPSAYVQIESHEDGTVYYEPFCNGMYHDRKYEVWAYHPIDYGEANYLDYIPKNCWSEDRSKIMLYPMMLVPDYGTFFFELITITMPTAE